MSAGYANPTLNNEVADCHAIEAISRPVPRSRQLKHRIAATRKAGG